MMHPLPKEKMTSIRYTRKIADFDIDFDILVTLFGEVLRVDCPFLELPDSAQRLMVGGKQEQINSEAKGYVSLFPYALPLIALDYLNTAEWQPIQQQLTDFQQKHPTPLPQRKFMQQDWIKQAYHFHFEYDLKRHLPQVAKLLTEETQKRYIALRDYIESIPLNYYEASFFSPVILRLLPITHNPASIRVIYEALAAYPTETVYLLLTSRLTNPQFKKYHRSILKGLQSEQRAELSETLLQFYNNTPLLRSETLTLFMERVMNLPATKREIVLYEVLTSNNRQAATKAHEKLLKLGMTPKQLSEKLYPKFREQHSVENMRTIIKLYNLIRNPDLLPTAKELLAMLEWANTLKKSIAINNTITPLLEKRINHKNFGELLNLLKRDNENVQDAALQQVSALAQPEYLNPIGKIELEISDTYRPKLIFILKKILKEYAKTDAIQPLLQFLNNTQSLKIEALQTIRRVLRYRRSTDAIAPLIQMLSDKEPAVRKNALLALRIFKDKKVVNAIEQLQVSEKDESVKKVAQKCIDWIANPMPESRKLEKERKEKIEVYLNELIANNEEENGRPLGVATRFTIKLLGRTYYNYFPKKEWN